MRNRNFNPGEPNRFREQSNTNRIFFGIAIALLGTGLLLHKLGVLPFDFRFSWPVILIIIGGLIGLKNGFRNNSWWILITIGVAHLIPQFKVMGTSSKHLFWPAIVIIAGLMIAFRPRRQKCYPSPTSAPNITDESKVFIDVTFGGRKEIITSKDFKGGVISVAFGGSEINLTQADFSGDTVVLDCRVSFGGVELIIPSNWDVQNEIRPVFGAVEDERLIHTGSTETRKKLILQGSCTFSGIEIKSY